MRTQFLAAVGRLAPDSSLEGLPYQIAKRRFSALLELDLFLARCSGENGTALPPLGSLPCFSGRRGGEVPTAPSISARADIVPSPSRVSRIAEADLVWTRSAVEKLLRQVEETCVLEVKIDRALAILKGTVTGRRKRLEWPPAELCSRCEEDWKSFEELLGSVRGSFLSGAPPADPTLQEIADRRITVDAGRRRICLLAQRVLLADLAGMDQRFGYFSWTVTRRSIAEVQAAARDRIVPLLCQ